MPKRAVQEADTMPAALGPGVYCRGAVVVGLVGVYVALIGGV